MSDIYKTPNKDDNDGIHNYIDMARANLKID